MTSPLRNYCNVTITEASDRDEPSPEVYEVDQYLGGYCLKPVDRLWTVSSPRQGPPPCRKTIEVAQRDVIRYWKKIHAVASIVLEEFGEKE